MISEICMPRIRRMIRRYMRAPMIAVATIPTTMPRT
jgi:hypothetical protein